MGTFWERYLPMWEHHHLAEGRDGAGGNVSRVHLEGKRKMKVGPSVRNSWCRSPVQWGRKMPEMPPHLRDFPEGCFLGCSWLTGWV